MRYCKTCGIHYRTPINNCMFCNNQLEESQNPNADMRFFYPAMLRQHKPKKTAQKILYFILLLSSLCCLGIDVIYTIASDTSFGLWSIYVMFSCILGALVIYEFSTPSKFIHRIYMVGLGTLVFLVAIALLGSNYHWAFDYVLPFGLIALNLLSTSCIFGNKKRLFRYSIYVLGTSILSFLPLLLYFLSIISVVWPALSCCLYGLITLFGLFFFSTKEAKEELKRRLHW